ncbi:hypothetical protein [Herbidospora cretacea]|uniref:hypothetical protein n=1 Tax=Herbidospora cretacea TaxID=28444 RepID=UPI0012DD1102|nr:hypothetical protein [Herbidospora cretacea]
MQTYLGALVLSSGDSDAVRFGAGHVLPRTTLGGAVANDQVASDHRPEPSATGGAGWAEL